MTVSFQDPPLDTVLTYAGSDSTDTDIPCANASNKEKKVSTLLSLTRPSMPS